MIHAHTCKKTSELAATSGVKVLMARPLSMTRNSSGSFSFAAAFRVSAMRPFCAAPSPRKTIVILKKKKRDPFARPKKKEKKKNVGDATQKVFLYRVVDSF